MNKGINLVGARNQNLLLPLMRKIILLRIIAVGLLFAVSAASVILFIMIAVSPLSALQKQEQGLKSDLAKSQTDIVRFAILRERIGSISKIISVRTDYYKVIKALRSKLPVSTSITSLELGKKIISLTVADPTLSNIDKIVTGVMEDTGINKTFLRATLSSLSFDPLRGVYLLHLELNTP